MNRLITAVVVFALGVPALHRAAPRPELWAFIGPWDPRSDSSLRANARHLDVAVTGWIAFNSATAQPIIPSLFPDTIHLARGRPRRMAIVTSWHGDRFHPGSVRTLAGNPAALARAAGAIAGHAASMKYAGLILDFESLQRSDLQSLLRVIKAITDSAHARGVSTVTVAIPAADSAYPARQIVGVADMIMPMLYDLHWSTSAPGAISPPDWVRSTLDARVAEVGASHVVAALPTYGYKWPAKGGAASDVGYSDAKRAAAQAGVTLERDPRTSTLHTAKKEEWEIWVTDAELLATLAKEVNAKGVRRIALWRIGTEDPDTWRALGR